MICANCGYTFQNGNLCPNCGIDCFMFLKTRNISIRLYNKGLNCTKNGDLSNAIHHLEQSLLFDKNNIQARNLLGLTYCEIGQVADALKHWIISTSILKEKNPATKYMDSLQRDAVFMEHSNDAIRMYNKAIEYLHYGSDDLAIIQLKKSIDICPNLIKAYNLLILCCIDEKNYPRAEQFIQFVLKKDCKNETALLYEHHLKLLLDQKLTRKSDLASIAPSEEMIKTISAKKTDSAPPIPRYKRHEQQTQFIDPKTIVSFALGVLSASMVIMALIVPALNEGKNEEIKALQLQVDSYLGSTQMQPQEVIEMRLRLDTLEEENKILRSEENKQYNLELLQLAVSQLADGDYLSCVNTLSQIETMGFDETALSQYTSLTATAYPQAGDSLYLKGKGEYLSNNFSDAKVTLEHLLNFATDASIIDDAYFYLGKIAENENNIEKAKEYYYKVLQEYPETDQRTNIENALQQLTLE